MPKVMSNLLIADAINRLQFAEKWDQIMIKKPHAEETVTEIPVAQPSVPKRIKVISGWAPKGRVEDLFRAFIQKTCYDKMF